MENNELQEMNQQELKAKVLEYEISMKQLQDENTNLKSTKEQYYKYWQEAEKEKDNMVEQLKALLTLIGNIVK